VPVVSVHVSVAGRDPSIGHEDHNLMNRLWVLRKVVPEGSRVVVPRQMRSWITLLGVNEVRELCWVTQEEDGGVVCDKVPVALLGLELDGETSRITSEIARAGLATNSGESGGDWTLGTLLEHVGHTEVLETVGTFPYTVGSRSFGVHDSLWDSGISSALVGESRLCHSPLPIEVRKKVDQVEILQQERSVEARSLSGVRVRNWYTVASGIDAANQLAISTMPLATTAQQPKPGGRNTYASFDFVSASSL
jgi:hypothetical protein